MSLACANVSRKSKVSIFTARKRSLRRLCFYTWLSFILFTVGGGGVPDQVHPPGADTIPLTRYTPRSRPPTGPDIPPWSRHPPDQVHIPLRPGTPPRAEHAGRYGERAGGPHPTGMHSCFLMPTLYGSRLVWMRHKNGFQNNAEILLKFYTL